MNTNKKIMLMLLLCLGYAELHCSQATNAMPLSNRPQQQTVVNLPAQRQTNPSFRQRNSSATEYISEIEMLNAIITREKNANKNYDDIEYHANEYIKQNYKTDRMKYDILLLMNSGLLTIEHNHKQKDPTTLEPSPLETTTKTNAEFMRVNIPTASIENFPTIFEVLEKTTGTDPENKNRPVIINGLQATLRAINGAIADIKYDKKYIFASDIETRLRGMQKQIENRIQELNPISWLKLSLGVGSLVAVAAAAGAYYSGITMKDSQEYFADIIKKYQPTANMISALPQN